MSAPETYDAACARSKGGGMEAVGIKTNEGRDNSPQNTRCNDPLDWLATQNKEVKDKNKRLAKELYDWKLNATETSERLRRVCQNVNKHNYVDSFYDSSMKRVIKSLTEENVILKNELCIKDVCNTATKLSEQRNTIQALKDKLEIRSRENKLLKNEMENLKCSDSISELKNNFLGLQRINLKTTVENANLKNHLKNQTDIMSCLKSQFGKQRKEFIKIFTEHYLQHGDDFIKQLKSLDGGGTVPEFLTKPLHRDISTSTGDLIIDPSFDIPISNFPDANKDSGIDTLPEEFRELMTKSRELEEAKNMITHLEEEASRCKTNQDTKMNNLLTSFSDKNKSLENRTKMLEEDLTRTKKELVNATHEASSWKTALQLYRSENSSHRQSYPFESDTQEYRKRGVTRDLVRAKEPHQVVKWHGTTNPQPILVRDGPAKKSDSHCPTETQDVSRYSPRGPLSLSPPVTDNLAICSKFLPERKKSTENDQLSLDTSLERKPQFIQCDKCRKDIEVENFAAHYTHCG